MDKSIQITIPAYKLSILDKEIIRVNKKLKKYKLPEMVVAKLSEQLKIVFNKTFLHIPSITLSISNVISPIDNVYPLGVIKSDKLLFTHAKELFGIKAVENKPQCDICLQYRDKEKTYMIYNHVTKEILYSGGECIKEYINQVNADNVFNTYIDTLTFLRDLESFSLKASDNKFKINSADVMPFEYFLIKVSTLIRLEGYKSPKHNSNSTGTRAMDNDIEFIATPVDISLAETVSKWIDGLDSKQDYNKKLIKLKERGYIDYSAVNILASAVWVHQQKLKKELDCLDSSYQHSVGDVISKELILIDQNKYPVSFNNKMRMCYVYLFKDGSHNIYEWKTSGDKDFKVGESLIVEAKVKGHINKNGKNITVLTRCSVKEEIYVNS